KTRAVCAFNAAQRAAVRLDNFARDAEPKSGAVSARAHEWLKYFLALLRCDAGTGVFDGDAAALVLKLNLRFDPAAVRCVLDGIEQKIVERAGHAFFVYTPLGVRCVAAECEICLRGLLAHVVDPYLQPRLQRNRRTAQLAEARDREQAFEQIVEPLDLIENRV